MLATSVFLFHRTFHFDPFVKGENDHLEIVLKSLAAGKIFLVYKKARVLLSVPGSEPYNIEQTDILWLVGSTHVGNDCHGNFQIKTDVFCFVLAFPNKTFYVFFSVTALK